MSKNFDIPLQKDDSELNENPLPVISWKNVTRLQSQELSKVNNLKKNELQTVVKKSGIDTKGITLSHEQKNETVTQLEKSSLSSEEKQKAKQIMKKWSFDFLNSEGIEWWILSTFLSILSALFSNSNLVSAEGSNTIEDSSDDFDNIPPLTKIEFAKQAKKQAKKIDSKYWIPWEISLAQTILESGWWQSDKARENWVYFWVKGKWKVLMSTEDYGNWLVAEKSEFRTYENLKEAFEWYAKFLLSNKRYSEAFKYTTDIYTDGNKPSWYVWRDPIAFLHEIKKAWYATDSNYIGKIANVMKSVEKRNV